MKDEHGQSFLKGEKRTCSERFNLTEPRRISVFLSAATAQFISY